MPSIDSRYTADGIWLRGNLHTHSTESDGVRPPQLVADDYAARGYDFLAISDHDTFTDPSSYETSALITIPAVETSANGPHVLHLPATQAVEPVEDRQEVIDAITDDGGVAIPAHPNWQPSFDHWSIDLLSEIEGYVGIEIYNGLVEQHPGDARATDVWDQLLSSGRRVWGYANDDAHRPWEVAKAWNVVQVHERTRPAILDALAHGRSYASTGVTIESIRVDDGVIDLETTNATRIDLISDHGVVQQRIDGPAATFRVPDQLVHHGPDFSYIRVECRGAGGVQAWTQPFFLT